jgi:hypothetical protein
MDIVSNRLLEIAPNNRPCNYGKAGSQLLCGKCMIAEMALTLFILKQSLLYDMPEDTLQQTVFAP